VTGVGEKSDLTGSGEGTGVEELIAKKRDL